MKIKHNVYIILNKYGDLWTNTFFFSKWEAERYIKKFWEGIDVDFKKHKYQITKIKIKKDETRNY